MNHLGVPNISRPSRVVDADGLDRFDRKFRDDQFSKHEPVRPILSRAFANVLKHKGKREANLSLIEFNQRFKRGDLWLSMDDSQLREWCKAKAQACKLTVSSRSRSPLSIQKHLCVQLNKYAIDFPFSQSAAGDLFDPWRGFDVAYAKVSDSAWWIRQVRKLQRRELEEYQRQSGVVHHKSQIYASDYAVKARQEQKARNRALLSEIKCTNDLGQEYWLDELQELSVANPVLRRNELMTRIAGFEEYAKRLGYVGEFLTITCPSKYHSTHIWGGTNAKYQGFTVRESNNYLCNLWSRVRAKLHRSGVNFFGFRVAEPNHDGCPHWHFLLFMDGDSAEYVARVCRSYALQEDGDESGAYKHRFKRESIDWNRGSAAGYIAKYISKNIDGEGIDADLFGNDAALSARRIDAWAGLHGIRQFQQIGGPSVTVWRELRRIDEQECGLVEKARIAADTANWADFCELMGSGRDQVIKLMHWQEIDLSTGEVSPVENKYGEPVNGKIFGVVADGVAVCTRFFTWVTERVRTAFTDTNRESAHRGSVKSGASMLFGVPLPAGFDFDFQGANAPPWSSVNNCTV